MYPRGRNRPRRHGRLLLRRSRHHKKPQTRLREKRTLTSYAVTRLSIQRTLGLIYLIAFLVAAHQFIPLLGEEGLLPVRLFLKKVSFWQTPSLFWWNASDVFFALLAWSGVALSLLTVTGLSERFGIFISAAIWFLLWLFYLSFVNVGQDFYSFGWETLLLEAGFLAIFLGSRNSTPPKIVLWLFRWILFRVMFGAGLIKLRADPCWQDLTCMFYHYETQPLPNPLSLFFHHLPPAIDKGSVLFTHFVELIVPWGLFFRGLIGYLAGGFTILFQILLILSGNLSWLNYLTMVLSLACFDDRLLRRLLPVKPRELRPMSHIRKGIVGAITLLIGFLSIGPAVNLFSPYQLMNASFEPFHLVNTYGAFGSVTKKRNEIIFEGTGDPEITPETKWQAYEFKCKPGDTTATPCVMSPYHYRLDWLMWFAAMTTYSDYPWILNFVAKLLKNDPKTFSLLKVNPFSDAPPRYIRAELYRYRFTNPEEKKRTGKIWSRTRVGTYLPPLALDQTPFQEILKRLGWL